jgi:hypothetical protein
MPVIPALRSLRKKIRTSNPNKEKKNETSGITEKGERDKESKRG